MNQPARKGDPGGKAADVPVDDPSIPVLTERLTLPPLDLNLDFRLPERPAVVAPAVVAPQLEPRPLPAAQPPPQAVDIPLDASQALDIHPDEPQALDSPLDDEPIEVAIDAPSAIEPLKPIEPPEPTDIAPRVPTSLLLSNLDALLATPPSALPSSQNGGFDLTQSDVNHPNRMETDLREMILLDIARRLPAEVDVIVRRHLDGAIEDAIRRFTAEVRIALAGSLREIVDRAVKAELERLESARK